MSQALPSVLLRFEGPSDGDLLRTCVESLAAQEAHTTHWITDAVLPVETEASETYVWNLIARRLGAGNARHELQFLFHRYSHCRMLAAFTGHPTLVSDKSLLRLTRSSLAMYAEALGERCRRVSGSDQVRLGAPLLLPDGAWSWRGLSHISDELLRLVAACYICIHLISGYRQITMDILEPAEEPDGTDTILTLPLAMHGDLPIKSVEQSLRALRGRNDLVTRGRVLNSLGVVIGQAPRSSDSKLAIGDTRVSVVERQRLAPWEVKLTLPPLESDETPRLESTIQIDTATALLTHVYLSLTSVPDIPVSDVTISREGTDIAAFSVARREN